MSADLLAQMEARLAEIEDEAARLRVAMAALRGEPAPPRRVPNTDRIVALLREAGDAGLTRAELAGSLGIAPDAVSSLLRHLRDSGRVERLDGGRWTAPPG